MKRTGLLYVIGSRLVGGLMGGVRRRWDPNPTRTLASEMVQGVIVGGVLAYLTAQVLLNRYVTRVNGWTTIVGCGEPGHGRLLRAACADKLFAVNSPAEAMYWTTSVDGAARPTAHCGAEPRGARHRPRPRRG